MAELETLSPETEALIAERERILAWLNPPAPDPTQWPPPGWSYHPENPAFLFRVVSSDELQKELFGDPEREEGEKIAKRRIAEIESILIPIFFPNPKDEGTQRKKKFGFAAMIKTGLKREVDTLALYPVLEKCPKNLEGKVIDWQASLKLKEYREVSEKTREIFDAALIITPEKTKFELVRIKQNPAE